MGILGAAMSSAEVCILIADVKTLCDVKSDLAVSKCLGIPDGTLYYLKSKGACPSRRHQLCEAFNRLLFERGAEPVYHLPEPKGINTDDAYGNVSHLLDLINRTDKQDRMIGRAATPAERAAFLRRSKRGN
ncbi:hypothetical protein [Thalassospira aquimaris]|uniref:Uncharacterized protein n=1 Tax=Thalassospira aquimaris TaxID=3037796 RepID=A0ABT6GGQ6_9PROT|nr:hypothetical protein [Thalassospira sp. FZY0004]MDG4721174.1 hypothetical protein [Thalassospira sp. FZY0004]